LQCPVYCKENQWFLNLEDDLKIFNPRCRKSLTNFITSCCIEYTSPLLGFELTTSLVIGTDCTGSCKSNYHMIMAMMAPIIQLSGLYWMIKSVRTSCDTNVHVETFKTDVIVGIGNVITGLTSKWLINFKISLLILIRSF
jgi:hypothetical protein